MRVSREQSERNRGRIVAAAARLFREHGIGASGVDAITDEAGLTHGAFYSQFPSKEAVVAEALRAALGRSLAAWERAVDGKSRVEALAAIARGYLAPAHRDAPGRGCALAALGADVARQPRSVRRAFTEELERSADFLARFVPDRDDALAALAAMAGALMLARAVDDEALSRRILASTEERVAKAGAKRTRRPARRKAVAHDA